MSHNEKTTSYSKPRRGLKKDLDKLAKNESKQDFLTQKMSNSKRKNTNINKHPTIKIICNLRE